MPAVSGNLKTNKLTLQGHGVMGNDLVMDVQGDTFVMSMSNVALMTVAPESAADLNSGEVADTIITLEKDVRINGTLTADTTVLENIVLGSHFNSNALLPILAPLGTIVAQNTAAVAAANTTTYMPFLASDRTAVPTIQGQNGSVDGNRFTSSDLFANNASALKVFKNIVYPNGATNVGTTVNNICDENYLYVFSSTGTNTSDDVNQNPVIGILPGFELHKFDKYTGEWIMTKSAATIFNDPKVVNRFPPCLVGDYLYLNDCTQKFRVAKINKNTFEVVWVKENPFPDTLKPIRTGAGFGIYLTTIFPVVKNGKVHLYNGYAMTGQYSPFGFGGDFSSPIDGWLYNYPGVQSSSGGIFCLRDEGTSATSLWDFKSCPTQLQAGQTVPAAAIPPAGYQIVGYPLIVQTATAASNTNIPINDEDSTNSNINGVKAYVINSSTAGVHSFICFDYSCNSSNFLTALSAPGKSNNYLYYGLGDKPFTLRAGDVLYNSNYYLTSDDGVSRVNARDLFRGQVIKKKLYAGCNLNKYDAYALNFYGASMYGKCSYDVDCNVLYVPFANFHRMPLGDLLARKIGSSNDFVGGSNYGDYLKNYYTATGTYVDGGASNYDTIVKPFEDALLNVDMSTVALNSNMSPRWRRGCGGCLVALDPLTGGFKWKYGNIASDGFSWIGSSFPHLYQYYDGLNNDIVAGPHITQRTATTPRYLMYPEKVGYVTQLLADNNFTSSGATSSPNDVMMNNGVDSMNVSAPRYRTIVCPWAGNGIMLLGHTATDTHYIVPVNANIKYNGYTNPERGYAQPMEILPLNSNIGFLVPNSIVQLNDLSGIGSKFTTGRKSTFYQFTDYTLITTGATLVSGINIATGKIEWCAVNEVNDGQPRLIYPATPGGGGNHQISSVNDLAIFGSYSGYLHFYNTKTGELMHYMKFKENVESPCLIADNVIYVVGGNHKLLHNRNADFSYNAPSRYIRMITLDGK